MRLRPARRFIKRLSDTGQIYENWYLYLLDRGLLVSFRDGFYHSRITVRASVYTTRSSCAFRLIKSLYSVVSNNAYVQGKLFHMDPKKSERRSDFIHHIIQSQSCDFPLVPAPDCGTISFPVQRTVHPLVKKVIDDTTAVLDRQVLEATEQYHHTAQITDSALLTPAVNKLATRPLQPMDRDVVKRMIVLNVLRFLKPGSVAQHLDYRTDKMAAHSRNSGSASGFLPVRPIPGVCPRVVGTKGEMRVAGLAVNIRDRDCDEVPCSLPFTNFIKPEVIKIGKPARGIQIESLSNYTVLSMAYPDNSEFNQGIAIGLGKRGWNLQTIFAFWFVIYNRHTNKGWVDFLDFLDEQGAHESDKVGWEASTNINDGLPLAVLECGSRGRNIPKFKKLFCRAYTDSMVPFISVDRNGFWAPWRVPSGTYRTSGGNSRRHSGMNAYVCYFIDKHHSKLGQRGCVCSICTKLEEQGVTLGLEVDDLLLKLRRHAFVLGDDYIAVSLGVEHDKVFDATMDLIFGTTTKTVTTSMFGSAEFLRRRFLRFEDTIYWYKDSNRALAKLLKGDHRVSVERFSAAVLSAILECGWNEYLFKILTYIKSRLDPDQLVLQQEVATFAKKTPEILDLMWNVDYTKSELYNASNRPLEALVNALSQVQ